MQRLLGRQLARRCPATNRWLTFSGCTLPHTPQGSRLAADFAKENERPAAQRAEQQRQLEAQAPTVKLADDFLATMAKANVEFDFEPGPPRLAFPIIE
ncbi:hypothetical protein HUA78_45430 [Myxococcus sp. CA033]|uniref:hypothetical protein n=1 Tax=Myxococcus sp. CA033 TaxID=2741516 RepID=UPI00157B9943|nr:hypothetical protein [Myxococcus sp. CA033]NTX41693.1 hypothetical protein [Myxococcus sp. CA033]